MYNRYCKKRIIDALSDTPVVTILGPRQTGKTTLAKQLQQKDTAYITLDDTTLCGAAKLDPIGFIRSLNARCIVIDEVQRAPELLLAIKQQIDEVRKPGQYLLTGSANALMLPQLSDSLAGRMETINLLPLSGCEIAGVPSTFLDKVLSGNVPTTKLTRVRNDLMQKILSGGFPEPFSRKRQNRRTVWFQQYIKNIIQKDLKDLGKIEHIQVMPKLVRLLANQSGQLINYTEIGNKLGIARQTVTHYVQLLEQLYLFESLPAWHANEGKRLVKTPKIHIVDTGLLCALRRIREENIANNPQAFGHLLENYVVNEIKRISTWHDEPLEFSHYRDKDQMEVDLILETHSGTTIAIEIKAAATLVNTDFNGLRKVRNLVGKEFLMGIILYDGDHSIQHEDKLYSVPIGCLWE
jgi:predicted AAA+ superfamily ATPase